MKNAKGLIKEIKMKRRSWDEVSQFKIGNIGNLSNSDLDILEFYAEHYLKTGSLSGLMTPVGDKAKVLEIYGITTN